MWLYQALLVLFTPLILLKIRRFKKTYVHYRAQEALGFWPAVKADLWIHCASVGEVLAARPLVLQWREKFPARRLLITTMTPTGAEQVVKEFPFAEHRYLPMDWSSSVSRALKKLDCKHLLIVETELWPNLLKHAKQCGLRIDVVNARLSDRSFQRYQKFSLVSRPLFKLPDSFLAHAQADADRFEALGAKKVLVTGSIKFDLAVAPEVLQANWRRQLGSRFVWMGGSTHHGEDDMLLRIHKVLLQKYPDALLILVPRHPERFDAVYVLAKQSFERVALRSQTPPDQWCDFDVVIGDSMGEMMNYYQACDVAFVGGSLIKRGGHNPIEPALLGKAIIVGPHTFNFLDITNQLLQVNGAVRCEDEAHLQSAVVTLAGQSSQRYRLGQIALRFAEKNQGAVTRVLAEIDFR
ncbi:3-deoxy-D-manno-octulosonic acid transferase [Marinomonas primoryensis]|jgi:3-deoxy-D-manno-octulosonic-acid transferase|uniref:3-deoxy-D-manno-octulosonic acid transferase n=1 Tax=Marinomonas primoryensis TaxID=178399 RepID=A0A2Z4PW30_9GAMM|nr:3-deoxy-D-manno-octulosonic acid transferase [Marinomonas primoryensis]AWY01812.1 3-deoxy-D-manno-octulosonic acid transferase [Marinomonas primoryensis]|tara:strand:- start:813 stop:2039 length:1227 start_codon:yes stop_codon:yes gene_type:complete